MSKPRPSPPPPVCIPCNQAAHTQPPLYLPKFRSAEQGFLLGGGGGWGCIIIKVHRFDFCIIYIIFMTSHYYWYYEYLSQKGGYFFFNGNPGDGMRKKVAFLPKACIGPGPTLTYEDDSIVLARGRGGGGGACVPLCQIAQSPSTLSHGGDYRTVYSTYYLTAATKKPVKQNCKG